jgi:hypothetical protein
LEVFAVAGGKHFSVRDHEANEIGERTDSGHASQPEAHKPEQAIEYRPQ